MTDIRDELFYQALDLLKGLIAIPRKSREENKAADLFECFMRAQCGDKAEVTRHGNNLLVIPADHQQNQDRPTLLLNSHIDTVKPSSGWTLDPFTPYFDESTNRLYGIGSNDAGASLVSLAATFLHFIHTGSKPSYRLIFLASCEEEVSGCGGMEMMVPLMPHIDKAIVGEPTGMRPAIAEKGLMVLDCEVHGVSGHAARNEGINTIYKALPAISAMRSLRFPNVSEMLGPVKISITQIEAGTQHNVVPDLCKFVADVRTTDAYSNIETLDLIKTALPDVDIKARSTRLNPSSISSADPLVSRFAMLGLEPFGSPTLSDQALMPWPSLKAGPGDSARSHSSDEYICLEEIREAIETYITILQ